MEHILKLPELALVLLIGPSGSGKSTFARKHFLPTEVISSDVCRTLVSDDETDQSATAEAFELLHFILAKRLAKGRLTVVDATNVEASSRKSLIALAKQYHVLPVAIVFNVPEDLCHERNRMRPNRSFGPHVVRNHLRELKKSLKTLDREGIRQVRILRSVEEIEALCIERTPLWNNRKGEKGPFDIIGDVHGCYKELGQLLTKCGYELTEGPSGPTAHHAGGRKALFLGDLVDRGPQSPEVLRLVMNMVKDGNAICVPGNHDAKLLKKLRGRDVKLTHGLKETLEQLEGHSDAFKQEIATFIDGLVSHFVFDEGRLVVAHAGLRQELQGRSSGAVREFCLYGETTGEIDEYGLPVRHNWASEYRGKAMVVYGHTPTIEPVWVNNTICIDTGCVFGGALTALRYPEKEIVQVEAEEVYYEPTKPLHAVAPEETRDPFTLDIKDVAGKLLIRTRLQGTIRIPEENTAPALEMISRFTIDPRWLIYLPPTMSPSETRKDGPYLEHPEEALDYYRRQGIGKVICEEKHMGSRAILVVGRSAESIERRFQIPGASAGICYTRTGRRFFQDEELEAKLISRVQKAFELSGLWEELGSDWVCLDAELMPWSLKAQELLKAQYGAVGAAGIAGLEAAIAALRSVKVPDGEALLKRYEERFGNLQKYRDAYRRYCWPVTSLDDVRLAPFHLLASEGALHFDKNHLWHMTTLARLADADTGLFKSTIYRVVELGDDSQVKDAIAFWNDMTSRGGEGMVVKPLEWIQHGAKGLIQPAVKCRGREYLRIIYGPEYTAEDQLPRLRERSLTRKRNLALKEFALGLEGLERFVKNEPFHSVHACVFGVLALETDAVDPRL